jgi:uncharacterized protein YecE (DUF72 family)
MTILVGCSGWSYDDWVYRFYPAELAKKKGDWFAYYAQYFQTVEINSTFYRPPTERQVNSWISKAKDKEGFEFSVKMPQLVTHKSMVEKDAEKAVFWATSFEKTCVKPLAKENLLGCVLLQLSPFFQKEGQALGILRSTLDSLSHEDIDYAVEFRHRSWLGEEKKEIDPAALEILIERNIANVLVDGPGLFVTKNPAVGHAYVRFHGRNYDIWYKEEKETDHRLDRYDYL